MYLSSLVHAARNSEFIDLARFAPVPTTELVGAHGTPPRFASAQAHAPANVTQLCTETETETEPETKQASARHVSVLTYNACLLPFPVGHGGARRVRVISAALRTLLHDADVLVLCELIHPRRTAWLLDSLSRTWPHQSRAVRTLGRVSGGVYILSKFPIRREVTHMYEATELHTSDRLAAKGVVGVELDVADAPGGSVYVFATHMHAPDTASGQAVRLAQVAELHRTIASMRIPAERVVLLAGDFNMDMDATPALRALRVQPPHWAPGIAAHTIDEITNSMVGVDGSCKRGDGSCKSRILDGVYAHAGFSRSVRVVSTVTSIRNGEGKDMSDHHAVTSCVFW
jgi:endonuclease/exonuclease/phosphatase family metal-dependent hydrolase